MLTTERPRVAVPSKSGPGIWARVSATLAMEGGTGISELSGHDVGGLAGIDFGSDTWVAGAGGGYRKSALSSDALGSSGDIGSAHAVAYAAAEAGAIRIQGGGAYSWAMFPPRGLWCCRCPRRWSPTTARGRRRRLAS